MKNKKFPNEPREGAKCWCCGAAAEYYGTTSKRNWCMSCKFADPDCTGPCNDTPPPNGISNEF